jgi:co-chaperonin GroES (HSP10)
MNKETLSTSAKEVPKIKLALEEKYEEENKTLPPETEPLSPENIGVETVDLAYQDKDKFKDPWCKKGDWVIFARYAGSRLPIEGGEVRILNDDEVLGTVKDPESLLHLI